MGAALPLPRHSPPFLPSALTAPAFDLSPVAYQLGELVCSDCVVSGGLCGRDSCRRSVLPQLAHNGGWLKLIGEARTEQKARQSANRLPESDLQKAHKQRKSIVRASSKAARKRARTGRGAFALWKKIKGIA